MGMLWDLSICLSPCYKKRCKIKTNDHLLTILGLNSKNLVAKLKVVAKGGVASFPGTVDLLVTAQEFSVGCNCTSSEKLLSHATGSRLTLIAGAADKVTSPTIIRGRGVLKRVALKGLLRGNERR